MTVQFQTQRLLGLTLFVGLSTSIQALPTETRILGHDADPSSTGRMIAVHVVVDAVGSPSGQIHVEAGSSTCLIELPSKHCVLQSPDPGLVQINAEYLGDETFEPSSAEPVSHVITEFSGIQRVSSGIKAVHQSFDGKEPHLSADGRYVVFHTRSPELIGEGANGEYQLLLFDSATSEHRLISEALSGAPANGSSVLGWLSSDGRYVAFCSSATDLTNDVVEEAGHTYLADLQSGEIELISDPQGAAGNGNWACGGPPRVSDDGNIVAFHSVVEPPPGSPPVWRLMLHIRNRTTGQLHRLDALPSNGFDMSDDGTRYSIKAEDGFFPGDTNGRYDLFLYDYSSDTISILSNAFDGTPSELGIQSHVIAGDGQTVFFRSRSDDIIAGTPTQTNRTYAYEISADTVDLVPTQLTEIETESLQLVDADYQGSRLLLRGHIDFFDPNDINSENSELYLINRSLGLISIESLNNRGELPWSSTPEARISADGQEIVFSSTSERMFLHEEEELEQRVVKRNLSDDINRPVSAIPFTTEAVRGARADRRRSNGGRFVGVVSISSNLVENDSTELHDCYILDTVTGDYSLFPDVPEIDAVRHQYASPTLLSSDGSLAVCVYRTVWDAGPFLSIAGFAIARDFDTGESFSLNDCGANNRWGWGQNSVAVSPDGLWVVLTTPDFCLDPDDSGPIWDIYYWSRETGLFDRIPGTNSNQEANGDATNPLVNEDASAVFYESVATNILEEDSDDLRDIYMFDRSLQRHSLISVDSSGNKASADVSLESISADGQFVLMESAGSIGSNGVEGRVDLFLVDRSTGTITVVNEDSRGVPLTPNGGVDGVLSENGRYLVLSYNSDQGSHLRIMNLRDGAASTVTFADDIPSLFSSNQSVLGVSNGLEKILFQTGSDQLMLDDRNDSIDLFFWHEQLFSDGFDTSSR